MLALFASLVLEPFARKQGSRVVEEPSDTSEIAMLGGGGTRVLDDWRGTIYDPRNGKTYKSIVSKNTDGTLAVKGCIAFFCQTQKWTPAR